jgi:hypothetical protein
MRANRNRESAILSIRYCVIQRITWRNKMKKIAAVLMVFAMAGCSSMGMGGSGGSGMGMSSSGGSSGSGMGMGSSGGSSGSGMGMSSSGGSGGSGMGMGMGGSKRPNMGIGMGSRGPGVIQSPVIEPNGDLSLYHGG